MRKNAIAVAVGALFVAPAAHSQTVLGNETVGTVQLYGKLYPQVGYYKSDGGTEGAASNVPSTLAKGSRGAGHGSTLSVDAQNTYIGFRGERALGGGLKAIWQVEQAVELDFDDAATWSNRNSFAGFSGGFGTIKLGNMDTIYKEYGDTMGMFGVSSGNFISASNLLSHIGLGNNRAARFHERAPHSIQYQTPEFGDIQAGVQYMPDEENGTRSQNVSLWSAGIKYDSKTIYAALQYEVHKDFFGGSLNVDNAFRNLVDDGDGNITAFDPSSDSKDTAIRFSAEYRMGNHRFVFDIAQLKYEESSALAGSRFKSYERVNWAIGWDARWGGPWRTGIQFLKANEGKCELSDGAACSTEGLGAVMVTAGVAYYFNRQTLVYVIAAQLNNDKSARFDNWGNGSPFRGSDLTQAALGMSYSF